MLFGEMAEQQAEILETDAHRFIRDTEQVRELPQSYGKQTGAPRQGTS
jgi:hypothetical protein